MVAVASRPVQPLSRGQRSEVDHDILRRDSWLLSQLRMPASAPVSCVSMRQSYDTVGSCGGGIHAVGRCLGMFAWSRAVVPTRALFVLLGAIG